MNWRSMRTAPKDKVILVTETPNGEHYNVVQAFWGRPAGIEDKDAGWWGVTFSLVSATDWRSSRCIAYDLPELRAKLIAITPLCWKPVPEPRRRK